MNWGTFVRSLETDIDWQGDWLSGPALDLEALLREVQVTSTAITECVDHLLQDDAAFNTFVDYSQYPRVLMDKFTVHVDQEDRFRVRLHRFWPRNMTGGVVEKVHYHKWHMSTVILSGSYVERRFAVEDLDEERKHAKVVETSAAELREGMSNSLPYRQPHQVVNESFEVPCLTLFVRGPSLQPNARIFNTEDETFYDTFSPRKQYRDALRSLRGLDGYFHPLFPKSVG
ncbi:hypothetical protein [Streptomyces sp. NBC_00280]|uniref:hypothetical protein n=1 Tax=Streptomyces sp. NBC_00280 TaxID=2975699 RepID=UPI003252445F